MGSCYKEWFKDQLIPLWSFCASKAVQVTQAWSDVVLSPMSANSQLDKKDFKHIR